MLDMWQPGKVRTTLPEQLCKAADAVEIYVPEKVPLGIRCAGGNASEADADVFAEIFTDVEPRTDRVTLFIDHSAFYSFKLFVSIGRTLSASSRATLNGPGTGI